MRPEFRTPTAAARREMPPGSSVSAMLPESSTTTATMFCCGRSVATLSAGCHNISSTTATSNVCASRHSRAHTCHARRTGRLPPDDHAEENRYRGHSQAQDPRRPGPQQREGAPRENRQRILEQDSNISPCARLSASNHTQSNSRRSDTPTMQIFPDTSRRQTTPRHRRGPYYDRWQP